MIRTILEIYFGANLFMFAAVTGERGRVFGLHWSNYMLIPFGLIILVADFAYNSLRYVFDYLEVRLILKYIFLPNSINGFNAGRSKEYMYRVISESYEDIVKKRRGIKRLIDGFALKLVKRAVDKRKK
jgi:hypothetical protein